jgi:hypothetical protein
MTVRLFPLACAVVALTAACTPDSASGPVAHQDELIGAWVSTGSDVSIGLSATRRAAMVTAMFNADHTYRIELTDSARLVTTYTGTWAASGTLQSLRSITLTQMTPSAGVEQGVFQVSGARLTYEVTPVQAAQGTSAATVAGGFGSSMQNGTAGSSWIQRFWSVESNLATPPCNPGDSLSVLSKRPCEQADWTSSGSKR